MSAPASTGPLVHVLVALGLAALIAIAYANSLGAGFVLDNRALILENPTLRAATWNNIGTILTRDYWYPFSANGLYRPLTTLSYLVNFSVLGNGDQPAGYHVVNLILHWSCSGLAYLLMLRLGAVPLVAALAAALFALHPIATEAVTNIVGRADLLATLSVLTGLACHSQATNQTSTARRWWLVALGLVALLGGFSKENAVVLLPIVIAWELIAHPHRSPAARRRDLVASSAIIICMSCLTLGAGAWVRAQELVVSSPALDNPILGARFWAGRATALEVIGLQIGQLLWPVRLSADYSFNQIPIATWPPHGVTVIAWLAVFTFAGMAIWLRRTKPALSFLIAFFFIALLPTANLVWVIGSIRADRFLYLPLLGFTGAIALGTWELARSDASRRMVVAVLVVALVACGWRTITRNRDWSTNEALWSSTVLASPDSAKAHKGYAVAVFARSGGDDVNTAIAHAERAVAIRPDYIEGLLDLGGYYVARGGQLAAKGNDEAARLAFEHAAMLLRRGRKLDRAERRGFRVRMIAQGYTRGTIPETGHADLHRNLAQAYFELGDLPRALTANRYTRRIDPWTLRTYLDISGMEARRGNWDASAVALFEVIALDKDNANAWSRLPQLYQMIEPGTQAIAVQGRVGRMDDDSPLVRRHHCQARSELARIFARAGIADVARSARKWVTMSCAATPAS